MANNRAKKWLTLGVIASGLLLIPRRSSRRSLPPLSEKLPPKPANQPAKNNNAETADSINEQ